MEKPCKWCAEYPYWCMGICKELYEYIQQTDRDDTGNQIIARYNRRKKQRVVTYEISKNGIRREVIKWR